MTDTRADDEETEINEYLGLGLNSSDEDDTESHSHGEGELSRKIVLNKVNYSDPLGGHALRPPRPIPHAAKHLKLMIERGEIDIDPHSQRDAIWSTEAQIKLLDSYFKNYYVPSIVFCRRDNDLDRLVCVDGKQRLIALKNFFEGQIPYVNHDETSDKRTAYFYEVTKNTPSKKGKSLSPNQKKKFDMVQIPCLEYTGLTQEQERRMVQPVQHVKMATPGEKLASLSGPWPTFVQTALDSLPFDFASNIHLNTAHNGLYASMARMIWSIQWVFVGENFKVPGETVLNEWLSGKTDVVQPSNTSFRERIDKTLLLMAKLAGSSEYRVIAFCPSSELPINDDVEWKRANNIVSADSVRKGSGKLSPIEFICLGYFLHEYGSKLMLATLARGIRSFRDMIHAQHVGKKMVGVNIVRSYLKWVESWEKQHPIDPDAALRRTPSPPPGYRGSSRPSAIAATTPKTRSKPKPLPKPLPNQKTPSTAASTKRKRRSFAKPKDDEDDSDEDESDYTPVRKPTKPKKAKT